VPADRDQVVQFLTNKLRMVSASRGKTLAELPESFNFLDADLMDSLGFVNLIQELEQKFNVQLDLSDADPELLVTLGGLADTTAQAPAS
jgi:acyl carrier protein